MRISLGRNLFYSILFYFILFLLVGKDRGKGRPDIYTHSQSYYQLLV